MAMDNERQKLNEKLQEQENPKVESTYLAKNSHLAIECRTKNSSFDLIEITRTGMKMMGIE